MSDEEFDVLDQLYFVTNLEQIQTEIDTERRELVRILSQLYQKGWIKILETVDDEASSELIDLNNLAGKYFYLATKEGLLAHNS